MHDSLKIKENSHVQFWIFRGKIFVLNNYGLKHQKLGSVSFSYRARVSSESELIEYSTDVLLQTLLQG